VRLYEDLASWFPLLTAPPEYADEARFYRDVILEVCDPPARTVLELGSGGGNNASHLKATFEMTLVDRARPMLEVSKRLNPECEHVEADMLCVRLGRAFDGVFVHDAVMYLRTEEELRRLIETAFVHTRVGGAALFSPDCVRETFEPTTTHGGNDGQEGRALRYVAWIWDPDPADTAYVVDFAYLLRSPDGSVRALHDRHDFGLFTRADWLRLLQTTGFEARIVVDPDGRDVFVASRPALLRDKRKRAETVQ
jgi:SAM-dependent methyltransferase